MHFLRRECRIYWNLNKKTTQMARIMRRVRPKKSLGQHFLTDIPTVERIAATVDSLPGLPLLEVGPGMGVLSQKLMDRGRELKLVELDAESVSYLRAAYPSLGDNLIEGDFLKMPLDRIFGGKPFVLTGNYPYNISSQIFFHMLEYKNYVPMCTGMIQREVALRLASPPGNKDYGILSVLLQAWYDVEYLFTVEPGVFNPPPKVRSAVIRMTRNATADLGCDERLFRRVVKGTFNYRRKMLRVTLKPLLAELDRANGHDTDHTAFLSRQEFTKRPEQLSVSEFVELTNAVALECGV